MYILFLSIGFALGIMVAHLFLYRRMDVKLSADTKEWFESNRVALAPLPDNHNVQK